MFACVDCMLAVVNNEYSGMTDERAEEVSDVLADYPATIVFDTTRIVEFMAAPCEICESPLAGQRIEFTEF